MLNAIPTFAQEVSFSIDQRTRGEYSDGYKGDFGGDIGAGTVILNRTRLSTTFSCAWAKAHVTLQSSGMWGQSNKSSSKNTVILYEAYADILLFQGMTAKLGRQELKYDDNRIFSAPAWANGGSAHDALVLKYSINNLFLTA